MAGDGDPVGARVAGIHGIVHHYGRGGVVVAMTDQERAGKIRALVKERRGYVVRGEQSRVDLVDKALRELGVNSLTPVRRAEKRVVAAEESR